MKLLHWAGLVICSSHIAVHGAAPHTTRNAVAIKDALSAPVADNAARKPVDFSGEAARMQANAEHFGGNHPNYRQVGTTSGFQPAAPGAEEEGMYNDLARNLQNLQDVGQRYPVNQEAAVQAKAKAQRGESSAAPPAAGRPQVHQHVRADNNMNTPAPPAREPHPPANEAAPLLPQHNQPNPQRQKRQVLGPLAQERNRLDPPDRGGGRAASGNQSPRAQQRQHSPQAQSPRAQERPMKPSPVQQPQPSPVQQVRPALVQLPQPPPPVQAPAQVPQLPPLQLPQQPPPGAQQHPPAQSPRPPPMDPPGPVPQPADVQRHAAGAQFAPKDRMPMQQAAVASALGPAVAQPLASPPPADRVVLAVPAPRLSPPEYTPLRSSPEYPPRKASPENPPPAQAAPAEAAAPAAAPVLPAVGGAEHPILGNALTPLQPCVGGCGSPVPEGLQQWQDRIAAAKRNSAIEQRALLLEQEMLQAHWNAEQKRKAAGATDHILRPHATREATSPVANPGVPVAVASPTASPGGRNFNLFEQVLDLRQFSPRPQTPQNNIFLANHQLAARGPAGHANLLQLGAGFPQQLHAVGTPQIGGQYFQQPWLGAQPVARGSAFVSIGGTPKQAQHQLPAGGRVYEEAPALSRSSDAVLLHRHKHPQVQQQQSHAPAYHPLVTPQQIPMPHAQLPPHLQPALPRDPCVHAVAGMVPPDGFANHGPWQQQAAELEQKANVDLAQRRAAYGGVPPVRPLPRLLLDDQARGPGDVGLADFVGVGVAREQSGGSGNGSQAAQHPYFVGAVHQHQQNRNKGQSLARQALGLLAGACRCQKTQPQQSLCTRGTR
ncbi:unnamed protein product [Amoebophrya sp. A25]|nr:unnamed protein product [Amoebophrya sp. A25]|eukprot:GSA25T00005198001.1